MNYEKKSAYAKIQSKCEDIRRNIKREGGAKSGVKLAPGPGNRSTRTGVIERFGGCSGAVRQPIPSLKNPGKPGQTKGLDAQIGL